MPPAVAQGLEAEWSVVQGCSPVYCSRQLAAVIERYSFSDARQLAACRALHLRRRHTGFVDDTDSGCTKMSKLRLFRGADSGHQRNVIANIYGGR